MALVLEGDQSIASVARILGVGDANLGNWVRQARIDRGDWPTLTIAERAELVALRRENARLPMARDLLKRAAAFWPARVLTVPSLAASATRVMGPAPSAQTVRIIAQFASNERHGACEGAAGAGCEPPFGGAAEAGVLEPPLGVATAIGLARRRSHRWLGTARRNGGRVVFGDGS